MEKQKSREKQGDLNRGEQNRAETDAGATSAPHAATVRLTALGR